MRIAVITDACANLPALAETERGFADPISALAAAALDRLFAPPHAKLVFCGHQHYPRAVPPEMAGRARYGSLLALLQIWEAKSDRGKRFKSHR
jgi:hypothetical protein